MAIRTLFSRINSVYNLFSLKPNVLPIRVCAYNCTVRYKMNTMYLQNEEGEDNIRINLLFKNDSLEVNKVFYFERKLSETLNSFVERLNKKIIEMTMKKKKAKNKKGKIVDLTLPVLNSSFLLDDKPLNEEAAFEDIFNNRLNGDLKLKILDNVYDIIINAPMITKLNLPSQIRIGSPIFPQNMETKCVDEDKCAFNWFKSLQANKNWVHCGEGFCYIPTEEDIEHYIKLQSIPGNKLKTGPVYELVSDCKVTDFLTMSEIEKRHEFTKEKASANEIRIVSYNLLADHYLNTKEGKTVLFRYCNPAILELQYRRDLINAELLGYKPDLLCLQEADKKIFTQSLCHVFKKLGFHSVYHEKEGQKEGCGFLYDSKKFSILSENQFVLTEAILNEPLLMDFKEKIEKNQKLMERLNNVASIIQIVALKCLMMPNHILVVGNTHLYFHPDADHIRLLQGLTMFRLLLKQVDEMKEKYPYKSVSVLLCGDFNSTEECGIHEFLNNGAVTCNAIDWKSKEGEEIENISCSHPLKMKSAYGTPPYTHYTELFKGCLDYIYFQTDHLEVKQLVPLPSEEVLSQHTGIPSEFFPSDHLALVADLKFKSEGFSH